MPEDIGASTERTDEPTSPLEGSESNAMPTMLPEASTAPGGQLRTRDVGVFEGSPSGYSMAVDTVNPRSASRTTRRGVPGRPRGWMAYAVFLMVVLLAFLIRFAVLQAAPVTSTRAQIASDTTATADQTATATPSPGITPNATLPVNTGGGPVPTPGPEMPFTVTAAQAGSSPTTYVGNCDPTDMMNERLDGGVYVPGTTPGGTITYRFRFSDGRVTPVQSVLIGPTNMPAYYMAANSQLIEVQWVVDPATADGSRKWAEFEVLTPSHLLSAPAYFWYTCEYMVRSSTASVSGGTGGVAPQYDCIAGGDQTFTFTGVIRVFPDPHSHTVTYHWLRSDGTQGPDLSITFSPGQASATVQPDSVVVTHAEAVAPGGKSMSEQIVVSSDPGTPTYGAGYFASCGA